MTVSTALRCKSILHERWALFFPPSWVLICWMARRLPLTRWVELTLAKRMSFRQLPSPLLRIASKVTMEQSLPSTICATSLSLSNFSGQTGSGKTFTMQGPVNMEDGSIDYSRRGLIPRTFEYLFDRIGEEERKSDGTISYFCKCAYVEIYNECIYDLLVPEGNVCTLREDAKKGVFVEGCREEVIHSPQDAFSIFEQGSRNRHVAETSMNRESSRSHSVFTIFIQSKKSDGEVMDIREARFNLVDLAGSERQLYSGTAGIRLKEAGNINKSLLALSNVINALVDIANGKPRHVHYRDSRLTFLLRDSLGGNAKTSIIAAVSPSSLCQAETLSTLRFAQRAKQIKNKAVVNKDIQGNVVELQAEVRRLRGEMLLLKAGQFTGVTVEKSDFEMLAKGTNNDAFFMLQMALERQSELSSELSKKQQQLDLLEECVRRKEQQITVKVFSLYNLFRPSPKR